MTIIITKDPDLLIETVEDKDEILLIRRGLSIEEGRIPTYRYARTIEKMLKKRLRK